MGGVEGGSAKAESPRRPRGVVFSFESCSGNYCTHCLVKVGPNDHQLLKVAMIVLHGFAEVLSDARLGISIM